MEADFTIVGLGEALFDVFGQRSVLGGAPLNVAVHAHQAGQPIGGRGVMVSRVGSDKLGRRIQEELAGRHMTADYVQVDPHHKTGEVFVTVRDGEPTYEIVRDVAWDKLRMDDRTAALARSCDAVCFGSLAQRDAVSRGMIQLFVESAPQAIRMFDVNLRQDYYNADILRRSCELASVVKVNRAELPAVVDLLDIDVPQHADEVRNDRRAAALLEAFDLDLLVFTQGARGTVLYTRDRKFTGDPVRYRSVDQADSVGAGDACSAGFLIGLVQQWPMERTLELANHLGAFVASRPGATPALPDAVLRLVRGA
jgi:fructokinase